MTDPAGPPSDLDERIDRAIATLTLERKIRLVSGADGFSLHGDEGIGLDKIVLSDGPTGVRGHVVVGGREGCLLPNASLLAQTWDRDAVAEAGAVLVDEAAAQQTHVVLGPTINLHRSPLGGRLFEAFSEDPMLTGHLAAAYVGALQERGIGASVKHFLGNESETERTTVDVRMSPKTLREVYLAPFEVAIEDANPWTVMAAYNDVNGYPSTEQHELLTEILRDEWRYDGVVVSDWYATTTAAQSANAGLDLVMPGPETPWTRGLLDAVRAGEVTEKTVDEHVRRLLRLAHRVGAFPERRSWPSDLPDPAGPRRREQLSRLAASGMVVLKNDGDTLPLRPGNPITLVGRHASDPIAQGGGSAQVRAPHVVSVVDGLRSRLGSANVTFADGVETRRTLPTARPALVRDPETGEHGIRVRVFDDAGRLTHSRHLDVAELEDSQNEWLAGAARIELSATLDVPGPMPVQLGTRGPGNWHLATAGHEEDYRVDYHPGPGGGFFRPKSHAATVRVVPGQLVTATVERDELPRILGFVVSEAARSSAPAIADAAAAATGRAVAVVVVGFTTDQETEGEDKRTLALPGDQDALVTAVAAAADRTVVVVNAATPVLMPWIDDVDAVLFTGLPGQEAGDAVAAALLGDVLPEGRLVTTFPRRNKQGPAWNTAPRNGVLEYVDGCFIGYRGWHADGAEPAFWFGHGLGYATWEYLSGCVSGTDETGVTEVDVTLRNSGRRPGRETVQVYLNPDRAGEPIRLIGWARADVAPGEAAAVRVHCDPRFQRRWDEETRSWIPLRHGVIVIARGLGDVRVTIPVSARTDADHVES
ncbi:glycoside hydrolase family 3 C-terminal domain-containing protein [Pseudonocardia sp. C8]|uniref:beta-glucosidase n=1 Tax=Pseudonocardia sp. C8 TaxID=2762759 RepID=UPI001642D988|nr:glycoside hydrolase family 3 C-terminal domain-containing protein [Pseudonocardia sp. C8]MBC3194890.1 glycoside hydrolase family 3 C-terminal domain-containing protein [Pseudonocardia sp. C8]